MKHPTTSPGLRIGDPASPVAEPTPDYLSMVSDWTVVAALQGGTRAMRAAGEVYLPREVEEEQRRYDFRLSRSFLFPGYPQTVKECVSRPFSREVTTSGTLDSRLDVIERNADLAGSTLTTFLRDQFMTALDHGISHVLVDFPKTDGNQTAADEQSGKVRPYFVHIDPKNLIGWRHTNDPETGEVILVQARWTEIRRESDGPYGEKLVNWIRVLNARSTTFDEDSNQEIQIPGTWEEWRENDDEPGHYTRVSRGPYMWPRNGLPIFTAYFEKIGTMMGKPTLMELAWKNIEHWQSASDYRMAVRFALLIMLTATGLSRTELKEGIKAGHGMWNAFTSPTAKLEFTEAKGDALEQGRKTKDEIRDEMEILGLRPLIRKSANTTATSQRSNDDKNEAPIQMWVREMNRVAWQCYDAASAWYGVELSDEFSVEIFNEFKLLESRTDVMVMLLKMREGMNPEIDHETFLTEAQKQGILSDELDPQDIIAKVNQEISDNAGLFVEPGDGGEGDEGGAAA